MSEYNIVFAGRSFYAHPDEVGIREWGKPTQALKPGSVITIPAGVKHWHGAAKDSWFSVDCDAEPEMADLGIFVSTDPVALDQACVDAVYHSPDPGKAALIERMESRNGIHTVEAAMELGLGSRQYAIIKIN